jgi:hypothetical protein
MASVESTLVCHETHPDGLSTSHQEPALLLYLLIYLLMSNSYQPLLPAKDKVIFCNNLQTKISQILIYSPMILDQQPLLLKTNLQPLQSKPKLFKVLLTRTFMSYTIQTLSFQLLKSSFIMYDDQTSTPVQEFTNIDDNHWLVNSPTSNLQNETSMTTMLNNYSNFEE